MEDIVDYNLNNEEEIFNFSKLKQVYNKEQNLDQKNTKNEMHSILLDFENSNFINTKIT